MDFFANFLEKEKISFEEQLVLLVVDYAATSNLPFVLIPSFKLHHPNIMAEGPSIRKHIGSHKSSIFLEF